MKLVQRILVAVDFDAQSESVLGTASTVARRFQSQTILLHVLPIPKELSSQSNSVVKLAKERAEQLLSSYADRLRQEGVSQTETIVVEGMVSDEILRHAQQFDVNAILLGSGSRGPDRMGTTTEQVLSLATKPVWTIQSPGESLRSILCPVDFQAASRRALTNAVHLARSFGAELCVMTVVAPPAGIRSLLWGGDERASDQAFQKAEKRMARLLRRFDMDGVRWRSVVREGEWVSEILAATRDLQSDLVVSGSEDSSGWTGMLRGSTVRQLARQVSCSLITMRAEGAIRLEFDRQLADVETHFQRGSDLLAHGFPEEAAGELELCVRGNALFLPGWNALAEAYQRMGDEARAEDCRTTAKHLRDSLAWQQIVADVRRRHPFWQASAARASGV